MPLGGISGAAWKREGQALEAMFDSLGASAICSDIGSPELTAALGDMTNEDQNAAGPTTGNIRPADW